MFTLRALFFIAFFLLIGSSILLSQTFTRILTGDIVNDVTDSRGNSWTDYNNDSYSDLFVTNFYNQNNLLYLNNGNGTFRKITSGVVVNDNATSYECVWGDYDNDGYSDLFIANFGGANNMLFNNNGDGTFTQVTVGAIVNSGGNSRGARLLVFYENGNNAFSKV